MIKSFGMDDRKRASRATRALCLALALCLSLCGCATFDNFKAAMDQRGGTQQAEQPVPEQPGDPIKIGVFEPLTGSDAEAAASEIRGIELAHELYGRVLGRPVELVYADNQSDAALATAAALQLTQEGVSVVIGSYRNVLSMAAQDIFEEAELPAVACTNTNPLVTSTSDYYFRVCVVDAFQGNSAAKYVLEYMQKTSAAVLAQAGDDYSSAMIDRFRAKIETVTGTLNNVRLIEYPEGTTDFTPYLDKIKSFGSDYVFFPSSAELGEQVIYDAYHSGYYFNWIGSSSWESIIDQAKTAGRKDLGHLNNAAYVSFFDAEAELSPETEIFLREYARRYGDEVPAESVALGYDAYLVAVNAIKTAKDPSDGKLIATVMSKIFELEGATGKITLSADGDPIKDVVIMRIKAGAAYAAFTATPKWGE